MKRLVARYEQCDDIVGGKDVVGTIEPRLHVNAGTNVVDEKPRQSEISVARIVDVIVVIAATAVSAMMVITVLKTLARRTLGG